MEPQTTRSALAEGYARVRRQGSNLSLDEHLAAVTELQELESLVHATRLWHLAHVAALEERADEDGTTTVTHRGLGHQELDAPELIAPCLGVSVHAASNRLSQAIALTTRTPQLVDEVADGALDGYRATVITEELTDASPEVAGAVADALIEHSRRAGGWRETAGPLRRRARKVLGALSPDDLVLRAQRERQRHGLTRRLGGLVTDQWEAALPVEQSRTAWEAIDLVARKLYAEDAQITLARARADAMMQLILGQTTATVHLHATTPEALPATALPTPTKTPAPTATGGIATTVTSAVGATAATGGMTTTLNRAVGATAAPAPSAVAIGEGRDSAGIAGCLPSAGLVEVGGFGGPGTTHLPAQWLATLAGPRERTDQGNGRSPRVVIAPALTCHRETGALLRGDLPAGLSRGGKRLTRRQPVSGAPPEPREVGYRIPAAMRRLVEVRDGRCRFPGCSVSIRFCDLDHVVPWPLGPTDPGNLICLCRRHHRLKQGRDGWQRWRPTLLPDGRVTWIDPVGRRNVTDPVDHLGATLPSIVPTNPRANVETLCSQGVAAEGAATGDVAAEGSAGEGLAVQPCSPRWDASEYGPATDSVLEREFIRVLIDAGAYDPVRDRFIGPRPTRRAPDRTRGTRAPEVETQERTVTGAGTAAAYGLVVLADQQPPF